MSSGVGRGQGRTTGPCLRERRTRDAHPGDVHSGFVAEPGRCWRTAYRSPVGQPTHFANRASIRERNPAPRYEYACTSATSMEPPGDVAVVTVRHPASALAATCRSRMIS